MSSCRAALNGGSTKTTWPKAGDELGVSGGEVDAGHDDVWAGGRARRRSPGRRREPVRAGGLEVHGAAAESRRQRVAREQGPPAGDVGDQHEHALAGRRQRGDGRHGRAAAAVAQAAVPARLRDDRGRLFPAFVGA